MIKFTYTCNDTRESHRYCEKGNEESIVAGWNRQGKGTGHSYKITKIEEADRIRDYDFRRLGSSKEFVYEFTHE